MALRQPGSARNGSTSRARESAWGKFSAVVGVTVLLLAGGIVLYRKGVAQRVATDPTTLCPDPARVSRLTVVLLDVSDTLTPAQHLEIENRLGVLLRDVPRFGLIQVFGVRQGREGVPEADLEICNPGSDEDVNELYQNPRMARQKWQAFSEHLKSSIAEELRRPASATSPLFESIQAIGLRTFGKPEFDKQVDRRLIVVSDLMQNVPGGLSMYAGVPRFEDFKQSRYYTSVRTTLSGVDVVALYLVRTPRQPWPQHPDFWNAYFADQGAQVTSVVPVFGAN